MTRIFGAMALAAGLMLASGAHAQTTTTTTGDSTTTRTEGAGGVEIHSSSNTSTASHTSSSGGSGGHVTTTPPAGAGDPFPSSPLSASGPGWSFSVGGSDSATGNGDDFGASDSPVDQKFDAMPPMMGPVARIVLYENANHRGHRIGITHDEPNLDERHFSDLASAARVQGGVWELCSAPNYGGTCHRVDADTDLDAAGYGDAVQSVRLVQ